MLLGRLRPGPRKAANHSQRSPLLGKLVGVAGPKHLLLRKVWSTPGSPHPANAQAQGVHRAAGARTCAPLDQPHVQSHLCTRHQHKPSAASLSDESHPVSRAGCPGHQQGKYAPGILPSENTKRRCNLNFACMQVCHLKNK